MFIQRQQQKSKSLKYNRCMYRNKNAEYLQQEQQWRRRKRRRRTYNNTKWARERSATHSIFDSFVFAATVESFFCLCFSQHLLLLLLFCRCVVLLLPQRFLAALYVTAIKFNCNYVSHVVSAFGQERFSLVKSQCDTFHLKDICMCVCVCTACDDRAHSKQLTAHLRRFLLLPSQPACQPACLPAWCCCVIVIDQCCPLRPLLHGAAPASA